MRLYTGAPASSLTLVAGSTYWIEAASPSGSDSFFWLEADPITATTEYSASGAFPGQSSDAFALLLQYQAPNSAYSTQQARQAQPPPTP